MLLLSQNNTDLKCGQCNGPFEIYCEPQQLPCNVTICESCQFKIVKEVKNNQFKCIACAENHYLPKNGFEINYEIHAILIEKQKEIPRSDEYKRFELINGNTKLLVKKLENFETDSIERLNKHCSDVRNLNIQLETETKIQEIKEKFIDLTADQIKLEESKIEQINKRNEELIDQVDVYEKKCIEEFWKKNELKDLRELSKDANTILLKKQTYLRQLDTNKELLEKFKHESMIEHQANDKTDESDVIGDTDDKCFTHMLSSSYRNTIKLLDIESNKCIRTYEGHTNMVYCVRKAPNNKIISVDMIGQIKIWNLENGECIKTINEHTETVNNILILSNSSFATCSNDKTIKIFDLNTFECTRTLIGHLKSVKAIDKISINKLVSCSYDSIRIWNLNNGQCLNEIRDEQVIIPDLKVISNDKIVCGSDGNIKFWNIETGECLKTLKGNSGLGHYIVKLSNEQIAISFKSKIKIWNLNEGKISKTINAHKSNIYCLDKLSRTLIISCSFDGTIKIWDIGKGECLKTFQGHSHNSIDLFNYYDPKKIIEDAYDDLLKKFNQESIELHTKLNQELERLNDLIFGGKKIDYLENSEDKTDIGSIYNYDKYFTHILSASYDNTLKLWDIQSNKCVQTYKNLTERVKCLKNTSDKKKIIIGCWNGQIKILNMETGECIQTIIEHTSAVNKILVLPNNIFATCSDDGTIKLFDLDTFYFIQTFFYHESAVHSIDKLSNDKIVSCSKHSIRILDLSNGECLKEIRDEGAMIKDLKTISADKIASGSNKNVKIWNTETGTCIQILHLNSGSIRNIVKLSNEQIAICDDIGIINTWNFNNGQCLKSVQTHRCLAKLSKTSVISCSDDKTIKIWDTETGEISKAFQGHTRIVYSIDLF